MYSLGVRYFCAATAIPLVLLLSCTEKAAPRIVGALEATDVALVGSIHLSKDVVANVAASAKISPSEALTRLTEDALLVESAHRSNVQREPGIQTQSKFALARALIRKEWSEAKEGGEVNESEISEVRKARWRDFERPPAVRVVHFVVRRPKPESDGFKQNGRALAEVLRQDVKNAKTPEEFLAIAGTSKKRDGLEIVAEALPPFVRDGQLTESEGSMDALFSAAAFDLTTAGQLSPIAESPFGFHVIRLVEQFAPTHTPDDEIRVRVASDVLRVRGRKSYEAQLAALRAKAPIAIEPAAESLMRGVSLEGPESAAP
jgi:PPIC-type PPIASE domain